MPEREGGQRHYDYDGLSEAENDRLSWLAECLVADTYGLPRPPKPTRHGDGGRDLVLPAYAGGVAVDRSSVYALVSTADLRATKAGRWASSYLDAIGTPAAGGFGTCSVDVKWTRLPGGALWPAKDLKALAYVLVTGPEGGMVIRGFAWRFQLEKAPKRTGRTGPRPYLVQAALRPVDLLMASHGLVRK